MRKESKTTNKQTITYKHLQHSKNAKFRYITKSLFLKPEGKETNNPFRLKAPQSPPQSDDRVFFRHTTFNKSSSANRTLGQLGSGAGFAASSYSDANRETSYEDGIVYRFEDHDDDLSHTDTGTIDDHSIVEAYRKSPSAPCFFPTLTVVPKANIATTLPNMRHTGSPGNGKRRPKSATTTTFLATEAINDRHTRVYKRSPKKRPKSAVCRPVNSGKGTLKRNYAWDTHTYGFGNVFVVKPSKRKRHKGKVGDKIVVGGNKPGQQGMPNSDQSKEKVRRGPGPGAYEQHNSFGTQLEKKPYAGRFSRTRSPNMFEIVENEGARTPAPSDYGRVANGGDKIKGGVISFSSGVSQLEDTIKKSKKTPGPMNYKIGSPTSTPGGAFSKADVQSVFEEHASSKKHIPGPGKYLTFTWGFEGKTKGGKFITTPKDFEHQCMIRRAALSPGPDEYQRFLKDPDDVPLEGPAPFGSRTPQRSNQITLKGAPKLPSGATYNIPRWPMGQGAEDPPRPSPGKHDYDPIIPAFEIFRDTNRMDRIAIMNAQKDSRNYIVRLPLCEEDIALSEPSIAASLSIGSMHDADPEFLARIKSFNFFRETMDYSSLYWSLLEQTKAFRKTPLRSIMWVHDVLVRNRVGPSVARNIAVFDRDKDGMLTHFELKAFAFYIGLQLNDYQLLWLARAISRRPDALVAVTDFDFFISSVNRKQCNAQKVIEMSPQRAWIASWTMQRVQHGKNRAVAGMFLKNPHLVRGKVIDGIAKAFAPATTRHALDRAHAKIYLRGIVDMTQKATQIQKNARMMARRLQYKAIRTSTIAIQSIMRMCLQRKRFLLVKEKCVLIQACMRMALQYRIYHAQRALVTKLSALARCFLARKWYQMLKTKTVIVQTALRRWDAFHKYKLKRRAAIVAQSVIRRTINRFLYLRKRSAGILVQSCIRMYLQREDYKMRRRSVTCISRFTRGYSQRIVYSRIRAANLRIATVARMWACLHRYIIVRAAVVTLQSFGRMILCRKRFGVWKAAAIKIQAWARKVSQRFNYLKWRRAAITMQGFLRMVPMRCQWLRLLKCVHKLTRNMRCAVYRKKYLETRRNIIRLQSVVRMFAQKQILRDVKSLRGTICQHPNVKLEANEKVLAVRDNVTIVSGLFGRVKTPQIVYMTSSERLLITTGSQKIPVSSRKCISFPSITIEFHETKRGFAFSGVDPGTNDLHKFAVELPAGSKDKGAEMEEWGDILEIGDVRTVWWSRKATLPEHICEQIRINNLVDEGQELLQAMRQKRK